MSTFDSLAKLIQAADSHMGLHENMQLAQDVKMFLWAIYDPDDSLTYPVISNWDDLLAETIAVNGYNDLTKDEVLSMLFGLIHRNRIVEGLWWSMIERGVTQKLFERLLLLDTD